MVRAIAIIPRTGRRRAGRELRGRKRRPTVRLVLGLVFVAVSGCAIVPRARMDECQRLAQTLRAENARLKDRVLALQGQNRDFAERAVDDGKRLAIQDEAIERLEHSAQAYQDERTRLEALYKQLVANLDVTEAPADGHDGHASAEAADGNAGAAPATARRSQPHAGMDDRVTPR